MNWNSEVQPQRGETSQPKATPWVGVFFALFACFADQSFSQDREPPRREIWVPTKDLEEILQQHPNAVILDRAQYEALIRDAGRVKPEDDKSKPPVDAVIEGVKLNAELVGDAQRVVIKAVVTVRVLGDHWSEVHLLGLPAEVVMTRFDGSDVTLKETRGGKGQAQTVLAVRGKGRHQVVMEFQSPLQRANRICTAMLPYLARPCSITVTPLGSAQVSELWPMRDGVATVPVIAPVGATTGMSITWTERAAADAARDAMILETAGCLTDVNGSGVTSFLRLHLHSTSGPLPAVLKFKLAGTDANVVAVDDLNVASWKQDGATIEITRRSGFFDTADFQVTILKPAPDGEGATPVVIEVPRLEGATHVLANLGLSVGDEFEMTGWQQPGTRPDDAFRAYERSKKTRPGETFLTHYDVAPDKVIASIRRRGNHFSADVDNRIALSTHDVTMERTIALHGEEGRVNRTTFTMPAGEQFLGLSAASGERVEWKLLEGRSFEIAWPGGLQKGKATTLWLKTRRDLPAELAAGNDKSQNTNLKINLMFENLRFDEAIRLAGYVALDFDDSWKVATTATTGLEPRDARVTPVKGRMAWFTLRDHKLSLDIARNESVLDAGVTAYALPRARNIEIEGQVVLDVSRAPLRKFDVKLPAAAAKLLRWDSPLIGEQTLDEAVGIWHLTLRKELLGVANVRFHLSLPADQKSGVSGQKPEVGKQQSTTLAATLPTLEIPVARRFTGAWVVEANTDTELSYETKGLQPLDALRAPLVEGYAPRHRLLAVYGYGSGAHELRITATRHEPGALVNAVVENLSLTSVLERDGRSRHQAALRVRHNGLQFFSVGLPEGSTLLSTSVEHGAVKPVRGSGGEVRIPLSGKGSGSSVVLCGVTYETPGKAWAEVGETPVPLIKIDSTIPVMKTSWRVFAPEGFAYAAGSGTLTEVEGSSALPTLAGLLWFGGRDRWNTIAPTTSAVSLKAEDLAGITDEYQAERWMAMSGEQLARERARNEAAMQGLQRTILPSVNFQEATIDEAVAFLRAKLAELVEIEVRQRDAPNVARITLELKDVPVIEALRYITELAGMKYKIESGRVLILPISDVGSEQYIRIFKVPSDFLEGEPESVASVVADPFAANPPPAEVRSGPRSAKRALQEQGISFPEGSYAVFFPATGTIAVRNTQPNLDAVEAFLQSLFEHKGLENPNSNVETSPPPNTAWVESDSLANMSNTASAGRYLMEKMQRIIFPTVQFQGASVEEAIEYLRIKSKDLDSIERDPTKRGVNIILRAGGAPSTAQITLELRDVPMVEALRYITELAGMKYKVESNAVLVVPVSDVGSELYTRTFKVPPSFLTGPAVELANAAKSPPDPFASGGKTFSLPAKASAMEILKGGGIDFPQGSSATFIAATNELIVRDTGQKLDEIEKSVNDLWQEYRLKHPFAEGKSGLIPIAFEIPTAGRVFEFRGNQRPDVITLRYESWEHQMRQSVLWALLGLALFFIGGRRRLWLRTIAVALLLNCVPLAFAPSWLVVCNAVLAGWLAGFVVYLAWRVAQGLEKKLGTWVVGHEAGGFAVLLFVGFVCVTDRVYAEEKPDPAAHTVIVPYDIGQPRDPARVNRYYLDYAEFQKLWDLAKENRRPAKLDEADAKAAPEAFINSALYDARIEDDKLIVSARLAVVTRGAKWARLPLPFKGDGLTVAEVKLDGGAAFFEKGGVLIENSGAHVVEVTLRLLRGRAWKEAGLEIPPTPSALMALALPASDGRPVFGGSGMDALVTEETRDGLRIFTLPLGTAKAFSITRTPGRKLVIDAPPAQAETRLTLQVLPRLEKVSADVAFNFSGTERRALTVELDPSLRMESVQAVPDADKTFRKEGGRQFIDLRFAQTVADGAKVTISAERVFDDTTGNRTAPFVLGSAVRSSSLVEVQVSDDLRFTTDTAGAGSYRVAADKPLRYAVTNAEDRSRSRVESVHQFTAQKAEIIAAITLDTGRTPLADARIGVPQNFEVQTLAGPRVQSWHREGEFVVVRFDTQADREARLVLHLARTLVQPVASWKLEPLELPQFAKHEGVAFIAVHAADDVKLVFDGSDRKVREIDPATVPSIVSVAPPFQVKRALIVEKAGWSAEVTLTRQPPRFSADTILLARASDLGLSLSQQVGLVVEQGAVGSVKVRLPKSLPEARVHGALVRDAQSKFTGESREYEVSFQTEVLDRVDFTMDFDLPLEGEKNLPAVQVDGAARTRRFVIVDNAGAREMKLDPGGAEAAVRESLPYLPEGLVRPQFLRAGATAAVKLSFTQLESTAGNAAIITLAEITTALRANGERWDTVVYSLANRSLQFLPVRLPEGAELIEVSVGGQAVRADRAEISKDKSQITNSFLVPLIQMRAGELSQQVKLVCRFAGTKGIEAAHRFVQPELVGLSAERTLWNVWVPEKFAAKKFDGNMEEIGEQGSELEKLQSDLSDIARLNRTLASGWLSREEMLYCWGNLNTKMAEVKKLQADNRSVSRERLDAGIDEVKFDKLGKGVSQLDSIVQAQIQQQGELIASNGVIVEKAKQQIPVLGDIPVIGRAFYRSGAFRNWSYNKEAPQEPKAMQQPALNYAQSGMVDFNDNISLNGGAFFAGRLQPHGESGSTDLTKTGSGAWTISGANVITKSGTAAIAGKPSAPMQPAFTANTNLGNARAGLNAQGALQASNGVAAGTGNIAINAGTAISSITPSTPPAQSMGVFGGGILPAPTASVDPFAAGAGVAPRQTVTALSVDGMITAVPAQAPMIQPRLSAKRPDAARFADLNEPIVRAANVKPTAGIAGGWAVTDAPPQTGVTPQLKPVGRVSLAVDVPLDGKVYHFSKLKDHAVIEVTVVRPLDRRQSAALWVLGIGLGLLLLLEFARRAWRARRRAVAL